MQKRKLEWVRARKGILGFHKSMSEEEEEEQSIKITTRYCT
jgi:hypothetical protein